MVADAGLDILSTWCDCDHVGDDRCPHSAAVWRMLAHAIRVDEGLCEPSELPDHRDDVQLVDAQPAGLGRVWRERFGRSNDIAHAFLNLPEVNE